MQLGHFRLKAQGGGAESQVRLGRAGQGGGLRWRVGGWGEEGRCEVGEEDG